MNAKENPEALSATEQSMRTGRGSVIVNADDWGRDRLNTDRTLELILAGRVSSGSAMVFMEDAERAAELAREHAVDTGLHLNFTQPYTGSGCNARMMEMQSRLKHFLLAHRFAPLVYRPDLASAFEYIVRTQLEEYERLYGTAPLRIDGHHHMHLCANVIRQKLLPAGTIVRRNFTFVVDRKGFLNRLYRGWQDRQLRRRHRIADYFFDLNPMASERLATIFDRCADANVEIETHPYKDSEYEFLSGAEFLRLLNGVEVNRGYRLRPFADSSAQTQLNRSAESCKSFAVSSAEQTNAGTALLDGSTVPHIVVCICTYKRPLPLLRLLDEIGRQQTQGLFTCSVRIVDNDGAGSASEAVVRFAANSVLPIRYMQEPVRGIARARNKVVTEAEGDYLAFIDDDEYPARDWLLNALLDCRRFNADGVLGPVLRVFDAKPPAWLEKSRLLQRPSYPGGLPVEWRSSRTSNVLIKRSVVQGNAAPFRIEIRAGEDQEFFHRKTGEGFRFVWSDRAVVSEVIPSARCRRSYIVRRALLQGACESDVPFFELRSLVKSAIAVPVYAIVLPFSILAGGHRFATLLEKFSYHLGKLLRAVGIDPVREEYVSD